MHDCFAIELTGECLKCFHSTDVRRACRRGAIGSTMGAYPRDTGSNPVEGNGHFFPSYRHLYLSSFFDTHTHTHTHTDTHIHKETGTRLERQLTAEKTNNFILWIFTVKLFKVKYLTADLREGIDIQVATHPAWVEQRLTSQTLSSTSLVLLSFSFSVSLSLHLFFVFSFFICFLECAELQAEMVGGRVCVDDCTCLHLWDFGTCGVLMMIMGLCVAGVLGGGGGGGGTRRPWLMIIHKTHMDQLRNVFQNLNHENLFRWKNLIPISHDFVNLKGNWTSSSCSLRNKLLRRFLGVHGGLCDRTPNLSQNLVNISLFNIDHDELGLVGKCGDHSFRLLLGCYFQFCNTKKLRPVNKNSLKVHFFHILRAHAKGLNLFLCPPQAFKVVPYFPFSGAQVYVELDLAHRINKPCAELHHTTMLDRTREIGIKFSYKKVPSTPSKIQKWRNFNATSFTFVHRSWKLIWAWQVLVVFLP